MSVINGTYISEAHGAIKAIKDLCKSVINDVVYKQNYDLNFKELAEELHNKTQFKTLINGNADVFFIRERKAIIEPVLNDNGYSGYASKETGIVKEKDSERDSSGALMHHMFYNRISKIIMHKLPLVSELSVKPRFTPKTPFNKSLNVIKECEKLGLIEAYVNYEEIFLAESQNHELCIIDDFGIQFLCEKAISKTKSNTDIYMLHGDLIFKSGDKYYKILPVINDNGYSEYQFAVMNRSVAYSVFQGYLDILKGTTAICDVPDENNEVDFAYYKDNFDDEFVYPDEYYAEDNDYSNEYFDEDEDCSRDYYEDEISYHKKTVDKKEFNHLSDNYYNELPSDINASIECIENLLDMANGYYANTEKSEIVRKLLGIRYYSKFNIMQHHLSAWCYLPDYYKTYTPQADADHSVK